MAENRVIVEGTVATSSHVTAAGSTAVGSATATDSTTPVLLLTIPVGKTFIGSLNVTANSRATTAAYARATVVANGAGGSVADGTVVIQAGSSRDAGTCPVTYPIQVTAGVNAVTLSLVNTTATTFNSSACCFGEFM